MAKLLVWPGATGHPQARAWESSVRTTTNSWIRSGREERHLPYSSASLADLGGL
jgi:hypothetical protein